MEYKIGQIFEIDGIWYQFVGDNNKGCGNCVFYQSKSKCANPDEDVKCVKWIREDGRDGHFVRLLPIGDVYEQGGARWQQYMCVNKPNTEDKRVYISHTDSDAGLIISVRLTENDDLNLIERKIGEIFEHNGEWYQCIEDIDCENCAFKAIVCDEIDDIVVPCSTDLRRDGKSVVFKKLEKDGVPITVKGKNVQLLKTTIANCDNCTFYKDVNCDFTCYPRKCFGGEKGTYVEIKTKEDMEETNVNLSSLENIGKNLKSFNLEAAKSGKPVCTRDGRKARIICFDKKGDYPIVALVNDYNEEEYIKNYDKFGKKFIDGETTDDLMMLPEKKEGWVNVYRDEESKRVYCGEFIFSEREKAEKHYECNDTKLATVSIGWYE